MNQLSGKMPKCHYAGHSISGLCAARHLPKSKSELWTCELQRLDQILMLFHSSRVFQSSILVLARPVRPHIPEKPGMLCFSVRCRDHGCGAVVFQLQLRTETKVRPFESDLGHLTMAQTAMSSSSGSCRRRLRGTVVGTVITFSSAFVG